MEWAEDWELFGMRHRFWILNCGILLALIVGLTGCDGDGGTDAGTDAGPGIEPSPLFGECQSNEQCLGEGAICRSSADGFPGNLLGLESRLRSALIRSEGRPEGLRRAVRAESAPPSRSEVEASLNLKQLERDAIVRALAHWQGNRTRASESLGISVRTLRNKIREYALR